MFERLRNAWLVLTVSEANEIIGLAHNLMIEAVNDRESIGVITVHKNDGSKHLFDYSLKPAKG